jgi:hypothetical protein
MKSASYITLTCLVALIVTTTGCFSIDAVEGAYASESALRPFLEPTVELLRPVDREKDDGQMMFRASDRLDVSVSPVDVRPRDRVTALATPAPAEDPATEPITDRSAEIEAGCTRTERDWREVTDWPIDDTTRLCSATWIEVLWSPNTDSAWLSLAQRWISAELNRAAGAAAPPEIDDALAISEVLLSERCDELHTGEWDFAFELADEIADYNAGVIGPGLCEDP